MATRQMLLAAAMAGLIGIGAMAAASARRGPEGGFGGGPGGWHGGGEGLLEGVTLTDDQRTALRTLMHDDHAAGRALHQQAHAIHEQIEATLLSAGTVTAATLAPLVQREEAVMQQLDAQRIGREIAIRGMLTPAQLAQAASVHAQLAALRQQERSLHGDMPPD